MKEHIYCVAGFSFSVSLPYRLDPLRLLPSFRRFYSDGGTSTGFLFRFTACSKDSLHALPHPGCLLEETANDMGFTSLYRIPDGYAVKLTFHRQGPAHYLLMREGFTSATAHIDWSDPCAGSVLSSLLRIVYSQAVLLHDAVSIHASSVVCGGKSYLFLGKSGTGKSTHSALWLKHIPGCELLNDDNPTIRLEGDTAVAYGTPWSGKTPCYKNMSSPVGGIARLSQAAANRFSHTDGVEAFVTLYPSCSVIAYDASLRNKLFDTLARLAATVTTGTMQCRPDAGAALMCHEELTKTIIK